MKSVRKIIEIDEERCDGCGQCVIACAEGAIEIVEGKARLIKETYCDGLGACLGECPQGALRIIEREAAEFDPEEVEKHLERSDKGEDVPKAAAPFSMSVEPVALVHHFVRGRQPAGNAGCIRLYAGSLARPNTVGARECAFSERSRPSRCSGLHAGGLWQFPP